MSFHFIGLLIQHIYLKITCTRDQHVLQRPMRFKYYSEAAFVTSNFGTEHTKPPEFIQGPGVLSNRRGKQVVKRERGREVHVG